jgi:N-acetylmuramic acid 6-phosphate etherase
MTTTETASPRFAGIDTWSPEDQIAALIEGQMAAVAALAPLAGAIAAAAGDVAERLGAGGRLVYLGAGTSGRLAAQDAAELPPTFGLDPARAVVLLAGGDAAMMRAAEGAEDDAAAARAAVAAAGVGAGDVAIGLAASGRTPFTLAGLQAAREAGALTLGIFNAPGAALGRLCDHPLCAATGAEGVAGSTRMKAGTAQRAVLTVLSTAVFLRLGHVYRGRMVAMAPTNDKLRARAVAMVAELTGAPEPAAAAALAQAGSIRAAVVMLALGIGAEAAQARLDAAGGRLAEALRPDR